jgi:hypothetical protein
MMSGLQPWSDLTKQPSPSRAPFAPKAGGAEQLGAAYNRISQLSLMATGGKSVEEQQLDTLKQIEKNTGKGTQVARPGTPSYSEGSSGWGDVAAGVVKAMIPLPVMP